MNILVVSQYFWPETFRINELVSDLVSDGHSVTVLTGEPNYPSGNFYQDYLDDKESFGVYNGAKVVRAKIFPRKSGWFNLVLNYLSFMFSGTFKVKSALGNEIFDVVFVFQLSPITLAVPGIYYKKIKNVPLVMWVQDLWPESMKAVGAVKNKFILNLVSKFVGWIYSKCDVIFVQSKYFEVEIKKHNSTVPIFYLPNWYDGVFDKSKFFQHDFCPDKLGFFDIVFAGNVGEAQDFPSILKAFSLVSNLNVRLIVLGSGSKFEWVKSEVKRLDLEEKVILLGAFPLNYMPKFFEYADALLVSLKKSEIFSMTLPSKVQSYMASGRPILAMLDGVGAETIIESESGLVCEAGDYESLANNIKLLSQMSLEKLINMGEKGKNFAATNFDKDVIRKELLDRISALLK